ncbi:hypothetical protein LVJ94_51445 [Pendulispora rubella]|uniref:DUF7660 domain-containing protein n=1 Tax=Pendulispora rubella TaxID=2741070 RepID=A0ABZ2L2Z1_9BACT
MKELHEHVAEIETRADLVAFIEALRADLKTNSKHWENLTLESFLGALASWTEDMDGYYRNQGREVPQRPTWKTLGEMLAAARVYE